MEGGGVSCPAWGVGFDCWTVFSILRGEGVRGLWNCWVSRHMIRREIQLPDDAFGKNLVVG